MSSAHDSELVDPCGGDANSSWDYPFDNYTYDCSQVGPEGLLSTASFQISVYSFYLLIFVIAIAGNGLVCYVVHSSPRMSTVTNFFIGNLAVGDMLMALFCVPFSCVPVLLQHWPFGLPMCRLVSYTQAVSVLVSAYTMVTISIDRYMNILWPLKPRMSKGTAKVIMGSVWLVACLTALPIPLVSTLEQPSSWHRHCHRCVCRESWWSPKAGQLYSFSLLSLQYVLPLLVLLYTYTSIAVVVWAKATPGEAETSRDLRIAKSKVKMIKMMVMVVLVFTMCWLPFNVLVLIWEAKPEISNWAFLPYVYFSLHWLAMSHSCYNPLIYCWLNARFRSAFFAALNRLSCKKEIPPRECRELHRINTTCTTYITLSAKHRSKTSYREQKI